MPDIKSVINNFLYYPKQAIFRKLNINLTKNSPTILIWEFGGFPAILRQNAIHSLALNLRGYQTKIIICDGAAKACIQRSFQDKQNWSKACQQCILAMTKEAHRYGLKYGLGSQYISAQSIAKYENLARDIAIDKIIHFRQDNIPHGSIAWNSFARYQKGHLISQRQLTVDDQKILRSYLAASLINAYIGGSAIKQEKAIAVLTSHGVYTDYAPVMYAAKIAKIPGTSWISGFTPQHFYFSPADKHSSGDIRSPSRSEWLHIRRQKFTPTKASALNQFISNRYLKQKSLDVTFNNDRSSLSKYLPSKRKKKYAKTVCIFAHINWDVALDNGSMPFDSANEWIIETIRVAVTMPDILWLVKFHPGEKLEGYEYTTEQLIKDYFPSLPDNIRLLRESDQINPLYLYQQIDVGLTLYGTVGIELAIFGKSSINVSSVHYAKKGFTYDAHTKKEYYSFLKKIPQLPALKISQVLLARKYAYHYFLSSQVTVDVLEEDTGHWGKLSIKKLRKLIPGENKDIDSLYKSIIRGSTQKV